MIKIRLPDKMSYLQIREEYLKRILKYTVFDQKDITGSKQNTVKRLKKCFPELYNFLFDEETDKVNRKNLKFLLVGPDSLPQSFGGNGEKKTMRDCLAEIIEKCPMPKDETAKKDAEKCCQDIFKYKKFVDSQEDAYWLLRTLDVRVCPYCNRIYTVTLPSKEELEKDELFRATRATFDHFYCQDKFPYLSLSLFNLIPSCYSCNLSKRDSNKEIVYPYDEEFGKDAVFRLIPDMPNDESSYHGNPLNYLHGESDAFQIRFMGREGDYLQERVSLRKRLSGIEDDKLRKRIHDSIDVFNLEQLYGEHKMEIRDILRNRYYFNRDYVKAQICPVIRKIIEEDGKKDVDLDVLEEMVMDMLFFTRINREGWGKRPLSKLISDVLEQVSV